MLILTRKTGQGFTVGGNITITITEISGDKVRVGIDAPREIKVLRSELSETMESNQQAATSPGAGSLRALAKGLGRGEGQPGAERPAPKPVELAAGPAGGEDEKK